MTYNHKEAFTLMWYACDKCMHRERIWNSRDGVTPYGCSCPSCGEPTLMHVHWNLDTLRPRHKLRPMQKFWRDGTLDEAEAVMRRRIDGYNKQHPGLTPDRVAELIRHARAGDEDSEFRKGWPVLDSKRPPLFDAQVEWVVNDIAELGVKIDDQFFFLYKGTSLVYGDDAASRAAGVALNEDTSPPTQHQWRPVGTREFGECVHPLNRTNPDLIGTVSLNDSDAWQLLPAARKYL